MNDPSFYIALAFYFVGPGLITYWLANQIVRGIRSVQEIRASHQHARVHVEVQDFQILASLEGLPGKRHAARK